MPAWNPYHNAFMISVELASSARAVPMARNVANASNMVILMNSTTTKMGMMIASAMKPLM